MTNNSFHRFSLKGLKSVFLNNKGLLKYMALSYFDKAIIFLIPLLVFKFFDDAAIYLNIEYIYSVSTVVIPLVDLGLSSYFYYAYRHSEDRKATQQKFTRNFNVLFLTLSSIGLGLILFQKNDLVDIIFIEFIVVRVLFTILSVYYSSYFRLSGEPQKALYVTLSSNVISILFIGAYFFLDIDFSLILVFLGQIICVFIYIIFVIIGFVMSKHSDLDFNSLKNIFFRSLRFSWPTILQAFIMMYITNYGKINALTKLNLDDGVLLSLTQRFSMVIFLMHTSILSYFAKDIFIGETYGIQKKYFNKYIILLTTTMLVILFLVVGYVAYSYETAVRELTISVLLVVGTYFSCVIAYLEVHYSRENKNIFKLYLAILSGAIFMFVLWTYNNDFLSSFALAMNLSAFGCLTITVWILYKRNYKLR
ncbi:hypothetical protein Q2T40_18840 [Winogradskyella maritima]|uniref:Polysaccharide biosynthesis protein n=1 Tax=Winogradskyella maritima TaxID=1517766 RepID=A0ABV8AHV9_9FLAO|nr:hypothetical protein [Winogradskyella maritima]